MGSACQEHRPRDPKNQDWRWQSQGEQTRSAAPETHLSVMKKSLTEGSAEPLGFSPPISRKLPAFCFRWIVEWKRRTETQRDSSQWKRRCKMPKDYAVSRCKNGFFICEVVNISFCSGMESALPIMPLPIWYNLGSFHIICPWCCSNGHSSCPFPRFLGLFNFFQGNSLSKIFGILKRIWY